MIKSNYAQQMELLSVILVSLIVVATAWCAYQATRWSGIETFTIIDVHMASRNATQLNVEQNQYSLVDIVMFTQYVDAVINDNKKLSDFYFERFRPDFKPAVKAWLATDPFENPDAPPHPFVMKEYKRTFAEQAEQQLKIVELKLVRAKQANQNSDNYVLFTVIFASLLLMGNLASKFSSERLDKVCFIIGAGSFTVITVILVFFMPIAL